MSPELLALLELLLVLGIVLGLAVYELVSLTREKNRADRAQGKGGAGDQPG